MAGGGGKNTTKTNSNQNSVTNENKTTTTSPAPWAAGPLQDIVAKSTDLYGDGSLNPDITNAWSQIRSIASQPNPFGDATYGGLTNLAQGGGLNATQQMNSGEFGQLASILNGTAAKLSSDRKLYADPSQAEQNLGQYANGSLLSQGNPYMDKMLATTDQQAMNKVNGMYAGAGRVGGGANAQDLARALSENETATRYADYNQQVQNQFQANQMMDAAKLARIQGMTGLTKDAASVLGMEGQALGQQAGIAQQGNANLLGLGAMGSAVDNLRYQSPDRLLNLGSAEQSAPYQNLNNYLQVVRGASNGYGTQNSTGTSTTQGNSQSTQQSPGQSPLQQIAGVGMMAGGKGK